MNNFSVRNYETSPSPDDEELTRKRRVLLISDAVLHSIEFRTNGFVHKSENLSTPASIVLDEADSTLPWIGQFIMYNASANKGWPTLEISETLNAKLISCESIETVYVVMGLKDERLRRLYRNKTVAENSEEACLLMELYLLEAAEQFPNAKIFWLGTGKLKSTAEKYSHIESIGEIATSRKWPDKIKYLNIFRRLDNNDIKNNYGQLNVSGSKKICNILQALFKK